MRSAVGEHSLTVAGADFANEGPGFVSLDGQVTTRFGGESTGEILQHHNCALETDSVSTP
jgi:hypothetical protein